MAILALPVNYYVPAPLVLMPDDAARVYATVDGTLTTRLPAGERVTRDTSIAQLENSDVELELARLEGEHGCSSCASSTSNGSAAWTPRPTTNCRPHGPRWPTPERRLENRRREAQRLTLSAPADGVVIPAPRIAADQPAGGRLPAWSGSVLDESNRGAQVEPGTLVCLVGDPQRLTAVLLVDDTDVKRLRPGQTVRMRIDQLPGQVIEGEVVDVARHDARGADSALGRPGRSRPLWAGIVPPGETAPLYQARVRFESPGQPLVIGGRGEAKVAAERITLARRIFRYLAHTFRLPM